MTNLIKLIIVFAVLGAGCRKSEVTGNSELTSIVSTKLANSKSSALALVDSTSYVYKTTADGKNLSLTVFRPAGSATTMNKATIVLFHGGGFVSGKRADLKDQCIYYASKGLFAVTVDYRLVPAGQTSNNALVALCIKDAKSAVRWIKQRKTSFGLNITTGFVLCGGSAGGFLACEAALNNDINDANDNLTINTKCNAMILFNPAYSPKTTYAPPPVQYVNATSPKSIFFYGSNDSVYKPGGDEFYNKLGSFNVQSSFYVAQGQTHGFFNNTGWKETTEKRGFNFLLDNGIVTSGTREVNDPNFPLVYQPHQ